MTETVQPGDIIGQFEIISELGRGSNGVVFLAEQHYLNRRVALKILNPEHAANPDRVARFFLEAQAAGRLNHPNIVQAIAAGTTEDGLHFLAMELISGVSAETRLASKRGFDITEVIRIGIAVAGALEHAWTTQKMTHGDIKPDNLMLRDDGVLKLTDLGLAEVSGERLQLGAMGTPLYAAPEVILNDLDAIDFHADMYSLGISLYEMTLGSAPFTGDPDAVMDQHLHAVPLPLDIIIPEINGAFSALISRMLAKPVGERPGSWREVRETLEALSASPAPGSAKRPKKQSPPPPAKPENIPPPVAGSRRGIPGWLLRVLMAAVVFVCGFFSADLFPAILARVLNINTKVPPQLAEPAPNDRLPLRYRQESRPAPVSRPAETPPARIFSPEPKPSPVSRMSETRPEPVSRPPEKRETISATVAVGGAETDPKPFWGSQTREPSPEPAMPPAEPKTPVAKISRPAPPPPKPVAEPRPVLAATPAFFQAARNGQIAAVVRMLDRGVPIDSADAGGYTALMWAAVKGRTELVKMLLDRGASPSSRDKIGQSALDLCTDYPEITRMIRAKMDKNATL